MTRNHGSGNKTTFQRINQSQVQGGLKVNNFMGMSAQHTKSNSRETSPQT